MQDVKCINGCGGRCASFMFFLTFSVNATFFCIKVYETFAIISIRNKVGNDYYEIKLELFMIVQSQNDSLSRAAAVWRTKCGVTREILKSDY